MKTIHLIRHAKSSWDNTNLSDHQRPLSTRGEKDCSIMSAELFKAGFKWPQIYCSTAQRAQSTIEAIIVNWYQESVEKKQLEQRIDWHSTDRLYTFSSEQIWAFVKGLEPDLDSVLLVGHNPAFTDFINAATAAGLNNLPTCGYVQLSFSAAGWDSLKTNGARLDVLLKPKMFK